MTQAAEATVQSVADRITELVESGSVQLPPLPELAVRVQNLLADEDHVDAKSVAELIHREPALAAELLRIANSAAFGGLKEVTNLNMAIARLGLHQVGSIVSALLLKGHFSGGSHNKAQLLKTIWDHSVLTGFGARTLAQRVAADAEQAFLAGLLHDCGHLLVLRAVDQLEQDGADLALSETALRELMANLHGKLGHRVLSDWKVPEPILTAVLHHEDPAEGQADLLLLCVQAAIVITQKLGFHPSPDDGLDLLQEPAIERLGLKDVELATLMVDMEDELLEVQKLF